jgi:hypothetical protein
VPQITLIFLSFVEASDKMILLDEFAQKQWESSICRNKKPIDRANVEEKNLLELLEIDSSCMAVIKIGGLKLLSFFCHLLKRPIK